MPKRRTIANGFMTSVEIYAARLTLISMYSGFSTRKVFILVLLEKGTVGLIESRQLPEE